MALAAGIITMSVFAFNDPPLEAAEPANYDEALVPDYTLPDPLICEDGTPVASAAMWRERRRPEIFRLFEEHVYGRSPERPATLRFEVLADDEGAYEGLARRQVIRAYVDGTPQGPWFDIVLYLPLAAQAPVPAFVGVQLFAKDAIDPAPGVVWPGPGGDEAADASDTAAGRVSSDGQPLPGERLGHAILARGYALATLDVEDFAPDDAARFTQGIIGHFLAPGASEPGPDEWRDVAAWGWGLSRALDYFETVPQIDARRVAVVGHSRRGKAALWAAARDERFAMAISNNSGCGGAALSRRRFGETVERINERFPHWFCTNFRRYNQREDELPVDQHQLLALIAPRPCYVASASADLWADPRGELLSVVGADPVYRLLGQAGLGTSFAAGDPLPPENQPLGERLRYHLRTGKHALTDFDWLEYLRFADEELGNQGE